MEIFRRKGRNSLIIRAMASKTLKMPNLGWLQAADKMVRFVPLAMEEGKAVDQERHSPEVRVHVCNDLFEASFLKMVFEEEEIPFRVEGYEFNPYGPVLAAQHGLCTIIVREEDATRSLEIIQEALAAVAS